MPNNSQSRGCMGIMRKADWMSVLDIKAPFPRERRRWMALSIVMYCKVYSSIGMLALILEVEVFGYERWKIVRHLSECFLGTRPNGEMRKLLKGGIGRAQRCGH